MKREQAAALCTALVMSALLVVVGSRGRQSSSVHNIKPSSVVFTLFQKAKAGDVQAYLACFDDELRASVEASKRDVGYAAFRHHIMRIGEVVKGISVTEDRTDATEVRLRVELVYADRPQNDVQTFTVVRRGSQWLIASISPAEQLKMPVPYGTPAYPTETESPDGTAKNRTSDNGQAQTEAEGRQ